MYINKIENNITFKINTETINIKFEAMKLLGSIKNQVTKDKNGENAAHLEVTEVVLIHRNIVNNYYHHNS